MNELLFKKTEVGDYGAIYPYTSAYGEGSCQHSPVTMYSLGEKYGDSFCIGDGFLFVHRANLDGDGYRVYLAPLGGGDMRGAFERIFDDAAAYGKKVKFITLTENSAAALESTAPGRFEIAENRELAEYMYKTKIMSAFPGLRLKKRRNEVNAFFAEYGERASVTTITPDDFREIIDFERLWVEQNKETHDESALERESRMIEKQLAHFEALHLSGIVLRIDGRVHGFGYGTKLSDSHYDAIAEKGDRDIPHVYKVLRRESVRLCALDCEYVNLEEDIGIPGLRALKLAYQPEYLLKKFTAIER